MTATALRAAAAGTFAPDARQQRALAHDGRLLRVLGGPGTGKTTLAVELVADRVARGVAGPEQCLVLAPTRRAAAAVREQVTRRVAASTRTPLARTFASLAFGILRRAAIRDDLPTPFLLSGAEQDAILRELLAGHAAEPARAPDWPEHLGEAAGARGFRAELRDLLMRAVEHGLDAATLADLGRAHDRPEWTAAAAVLDEYDQVTALARPGGFDPAWLLSGACDALESDPELLGELADQIRVVIVDDAQEVGAPGARLLGLLAGAGIAIVLIGDPDAAVQTFRGADPRFLAEGWRDLGEGTTVVLGTAYRLPQEVAKADRRVTALIGALGGAHGRRWVAGGPAGEVNVNVFRSAAQEATYIADAIRRAHLLDGVAWRDMAVLVRGQGRSDVVRRVLAAAHVPVADAESDIPLGEEDAVRPLLQLLRAATERVAVRADAAPEVLAADPDGGWRLAPETAIDLLTSPYAGADAVTLRRVRRAVRRIAIDNGEGAPADELVARALARPGELSELGTEGAGARRIARMLDAATAALAAEAATPQDVLWAMWERSAVADTWRRAALAGGRVGARADRDLDAVIAVLAAAADFADRRPGIGAAAFADHLAGQDVAADTIVTRGADRDRVSILTPHAAAGRSWEIVFVAGVQEGAWPDLRLRGSLLGSEDLLDALAGRERSIRAAQQVVRHDEARLFHVALTRTRRRVDISAVRDGDDMPSPYLDVIAPPVVAPDGAVTERPLTEVATPLTLVGVVAALRRAVTAPADARAAPAERAAQAQQAATLARLAAVGVRGADPQSWWALRALTDDRPRVPGSAFVPVSPSSLVTFASCRLRWLLTRAGGDGPAIGSAALGTLVHEVLADGGDADAAALGGRLDLSFGRLGLPAGWITRAKRAEAEAMLGRAAAYFEHAASLGWRRLAAEQQFTATVGRAQISGIVDRLETDDDGRIRVIDYKTGSSKPAAADLARHPQLGAYQVAVAEGAFGPDAIGAGAVLVQLGKAATTKAATSVQAQTPLADDPEPGWAHDAVADAAHAMAGSRFTATVGEGCRTCPVATSCPARPEGAMLT